MTIIEWVGLIAIVIVVFAIAYALRDTRDIFDDDWNG